MAVSKKIFSIVHSTVFPQVLILTLRILGSNATPKKVFQLMKIEFRFFAILHKLNLKCVIHFGHCFVCLGGRLEGALERSIGMRVFILSLFFAFSFLFQLVTVLLVMLDLSMVALGTREPSRFVSVESGALSVILTGTSTMEELYADNWDTQQQVKGILGCMKMTTIEH